MEKMEICVDRGYAYRKLLIKMLALENVGRVFYHALRAKTGDNELKSIYERLARNEQETARRIAQELLSMDKDCRIMTNRRLAALAGHLFGMMTSKQLGWILRRVLARRMYSRWFDTYHDADHDFWLLLVRHEDLQHELLSPFWRGQKKEVQQ